MLGMILQILEHTLIGLCLSSLSLVFFSLAGLIRLLPGLFKILRACLRGLFVLSFRLYHLILVSIEPVFQGDGIDLMQGYPRLAACLLLSLLLGLILLVISGLSLQGWFLIVPLLHGLVTGLVWDEFEEQDGFQLGVKVE